MDFIRKRITLLDEHTLEVVRKSFSSMVVKISGMVAIFAVSITLGRTIGPEGIGIIDLANRIVKIVLVLAMLGMNTVLLKEIAIAYEKKNWQHIANVIYTSVWVNIPLGFVLSLVFILLTPWITQSVFNEPELKIPLIISLAVIIPQILSRIFASGINGFRKIWQSNLVNDTLSKVLVALGLFTLLLFNIEITVINVAILYAIGRIGVTLAVGGYWKHLFKFKGKRTLQTGPMLKVALPLLIVSSTTLVAKSTDTVMLGWLSTARDVGFYSVASKLGLLTNFFLAISISTLSPKIASLYAEKKMKELEKMIQQITKGLFFLGIGTIAVYFFVGKSILNLWGDEFIAAYLVLIIITIGQFFNVSTAGTSVFLVMTGHEKILGKIVFLSAIINFTLNYLLIPKYGAAGAAIATASTVTVENIIKVITVKQKTGILTIPFLNKLN